MANNNHNPSRILPMFLILPLLALGIYGTMVNGFETGFFAILTATSANLDNGAYVPGGPPFDPRYTGNKAIDTQLANLIGFFSGLINGERKWDVDLAYLWTMGMFFSGWALVSVEAHRRANRGRVISWTNTFGILVQIFSYLLGACSYLIVHLFTTSPATDDASVPDGEVRHLPLSMTLAYIMPMVLMSLPTPSIIPGKFHYDMAALWQIFPILQFLIQRGLNFACSPRSDSSKQANGIGKSLANHYRFVIFTAVLVHLPVLLVSLTPASMAFGPVWLRDMITETTFSNVFVPYAVWNPPVVDPVNVAALGGDNKAELSWLPGLTKHFLHYDIGSPTLAILVWAGYNYRAAARNGGGIGIEKIVGWLLVGGPVALATVLMWERDERIARARDGKKGQ
ncbi:hypothetical protein QBC40DRAFT_285176 [Triangularia verruculosa]|uniref:Uncharacterized protein n=1 Tax=Triangularia verruculosa TaxID=2587418 RepID=A0AAN6XFI5_9PEZI|nr:hypothetical protein QBC40DRAFT_285176 [Triangularia verruculosa]